MSFDGQNLVLLNSFFAMHYSSKDLPGIRFDGNVVALKHKKFGHVIILHDVNLNIYAMNQYKNAQHIQKNMVNT